MLSVKMKNDDKTGKLQTTLPTSILKVKSHPLSTYEQLSEGPSKDDSNRQGKKRTELFSFKIAHDSNSHMGQKPVTGVQNAHRVPIVH